MTEQRVRRYDDWTPVGDDPRIDAVRAVLAGESPDDVAERIGVELALVVRWSHQFVDGGIAALNNRSPMDAARRDRFLALLAHEVRTPITVMTGWLDTLRSQPADDLDPDMLATGLVALSNHTRRLHRLADDLGDTAAVSMGRLKLAAEAVDMAEVTRTTATSFLGDRIVVTTRPGLWVRGDRDRLGHMLAAIVDDGLDRTSEVLSLDARHTGPDDTWVRLALTVPGPPPPIEDMQALLEPFDAGTGDAHVGLGIYVTRSLAVVHGGQCGVDADDDSLTFWIRLPAMGDRDGRPARRSPSQ